VTQSHQIGTTLRVLNQCLESEIHVQLHVAMEQRQSGMIRDEINLGIAESSDVHDIFHHTCRCFAADIDDLKIVPVEVERVAVAGLVVKDHAIAFAGLDHQRIGVRPRFPVDGPAIERYSLSRNFLEG